MVRAHGFGANCIPIINVWLVESPFLLLIRRSTASLCWWKNVNHRIWVILGPCFWSFSFPTAIEWLFEALPSQKQPCRTRIAGAPVPWHLRALKPLPILNCACHVARCRKGFGPKPRVPPAHWKFESCWWPWSRQNGPRLRVQPRWDWNWDLARGPKKPRMASWSRRVFQDLASCPLFVAGSMSWGSIQSM